MMLVITVPLRCWPRRATHRRPLDGRLTLRPETASWGRSTGSACPGLTSSPLKAAARKAAGTKPFGSATWPATPGTIADPAWMAPVQIVPNSVRCPMPAVVPVPVAPSTAVKNQRNAHAGVHVVRRAVVVGIAGIGEVRLRIGAGITRLRVHRGSLRWWHNATGQRQQQSREREAVTHRASSGGTNLNFCNKPYGPILALSRQTSSKRPLAPNQPAANQPAASRRDRQAEDHDRRQPLPQHGPGEDGGDTRDEIEVDGGAGSRAAGKHQEIKRHAADGDRDGVPRDAGRRPLAPSPSR